MDAFITQWRINCNNQLGKSHLQVTCVTTLHTTWQRGYYTFLLLVGHGFNTLQNFLFQVRCTDRLCLTHFGFQVTSQEKIC